VLPLTPSVSGDLPASRGTVRRGIMTPMFLPRGRVRCCGLLACAALVAWAGEAMADDLVPAPTYPPAGNVPAGPAPESAQVTYTPMRRPGSDVPRAPAPFVPPPGPPVAPSFAPPPAPPFAQPVAPSFVPPAPIYSPPPAPPARIEARPASAAEGPHLAIAAAKRASPKTARRALGLSLDVGLPDGINLGLVLSPSDWLRLGASFGTNSASLEYRGGVSFVPVGWGPSFSFEAGHCNMGATNSVIQEFFSVPTWAKSYIQQLGYTYFNAHLGFDLVLGNLTLFLHGGYTYLMGTVRAPNSVIVDSKTNTTAIIAEDGKVYAHTLSAKLGIVFMFGGS
jgi:hypothetical protein